jgi:DNA-binding CsgD family transcriptional regulator
MELLERQAQLEELARRLREASTGAGKIAFVSGEAGAGKSSLVEQFAQRTARGTRVLWGHSDPLQTSRVLGPINEVLAGLSLLPNTRDLSREQLFSSLFEQLLPPHPLSLVILEDLHWADEATLDCVRFLGRRIQRTRCLLLATYRDDELAATHPLRGALGQLTGQHCARIHVPPLSLRAVEQLTRGTHRNANHVYEVTAGNPFFVRELLSAPAGAIPETVRDTVLARLMLCSPAARALAATVSLLPGRAEPWITRTILGDIGAASDEAVARAILRHQGEALAFRHELARLAVESSIPRAQARALHQRILQCLIEHGADLSQLVHHASHAQDAKALLEYAPRAAEQAALAGAHREAAAHLALALRHADLLGARERAHLFERHAVECDITSPGPAALRSALQALALWQELQETTAQARMLVLISRQHWKADQMTLADQHVAQAISLLETVPPNRELAMAYSARSQLAMTCKRVPEVLDFGRRALALGKQLEDFGVQSHALNNIASAMFVSGDAGAFEMLEQSLAVALEHDLQAHAGRAYANLVSAAIRHRSERAERYLQRSMAYCEEHDVLEILNYLRAYGAVFELNCGHWDQATRMAAEVLKHPEALVRERVRSLLVIAQVHARRGDSGVDALLDEAEGLALSTGEPPRIAPVAAARAEAAWYRGDLKRVANEAAVGLRALAGIRDLWMRGPLAFWAQRANSAMHAEKEIAAPYALMIAGDWERAAAAWQGHNSPYERALALAGGPEGALREALVILEPMGARPLAGIVRQRLREQGVREIPRGPRASTRKNPAGLTSREVQILALLVHGPTDRELAQQLHVSAKTVNHHVCSILRKLDVHSRAEAVTAAFGLGILCTK